jgi:single-strand DNA-binding protein
MNWIQIAGHLAADPETRVLPSGQKVTNFRVGVNSKRAGKEETIWWRVTVWGDRFDKMMSYLKKGSAVIVIGEMHKPEIWKDKEGNSQISMEMTAESIRFSPFGRPDRDKEQQPGQPQQGGYVYSGAAPAKEQQSSPQQGGYAMAGNKKGKEEQENEDDDLPF